MTLVFEALGLTRFVFLIGVGQPSSRFEASALIPLLLFLIGGWGGQYHLLMVVCCQKRVKANLST